MFYNSINNVHRSETERTTQSRDNNLTIGRIAPDFMALTTQGYIRFSDYRGKWVIFSSTPMAFTSVSTTEMIGAAMMYPELQKRNTEFIVLTTDNNYANLAWINEIYQKTGVLIPFPIISDNDKVIASLYGMMSPDRLFDITVRDSFLINPEGYIRSILTLPITCGRSGDELLRVIDSLQITENYGLATPAGWKPGDAVVIPAPNTVDGMMEVNQQTDPNRMCPFWYLCYTNLSSVIEADDNTADPELSAQCFYKKNQK